VAHTTQESVAYFESAYASAQVADADYFDRDQKREVAEAELSFMASLPGGGRSLLDIGAGSGIFAEVAAAKGYLATAVDPAMGRLATEPGIPFTPVRGTLDDISPDALFDLVTLWDVVEHAVDPLALLSTARRHLTDGGWLLLETGNHAATHRIWGGPQHWIYKKDHRWYFTPQSVESLLTEAGFCEIVYSDSVLRPQLDRKVSRSKPSWLRMLKSCARSPGNIATHLSRYRFQRRSMGRQLPDIGIFALAAKKVD
jgi:SAM-dependent methyltransferase